MSRKAKMYAALAFLYAAAASSLWAADADKGKILFTPCTACHGPSAEGNPTLNAPKLAGQEIWFLRRQIENFQKGIRGSHEKDIFGMQMKPMAATLDATGVEDVSAYLSSLKWTKSAATIEGDAAKGQPLFAVCIACHGDKGKGNATLNAPRIAGQEDWYLVRQLRHFATDVRGSDPRDIYGLQMKPMALTVVPNPADDTGVRNLAAYVHSLE